jgi:thiosulfate/3-mercaptopyruvate sulfurtransferase
MENPKGYANPALLITAAELAPLLAPDTDPATRPVLIDLRPADQFAAGHLPGAVHLDLFGVSLIDTSPAPLRAFLWIPEHLLASRGVEAGRPVVVYDENTGNRASRAYWFLEYFGHPNVRVLDGGFGSWSRGGFEVTTKAEPPVPTTWTGTRENDLLATWQDVASRLDSPKTSIVDARTDGEYCGTTVRAARGGRIPGAVHIEWTRNLDENGEMKSAAALREMYEAAGVTPDREVVTYCQGGYRAASAYLALRLLGYPRVRNYLGSWNEWGNRPDLPLEQ